MKNTLLCVVVICLCGTSIGAFAQDEKEAIKSVIAKETTAFFNVDYNAWADMWVKAPYAYWSYSDESGTSYVEGWENLEKTYAEYFKTARPSKARIKHEWKEIRVYGDGAYVYFIQSVEDEIDHEETSQMRILEKKDGKWKVVCIGAIARDNRLN